MRDLRPFHPHVMRPPEVLQLHVDSELRRLEREADAPLDAATLNLDADSHGSWRVELCPHHPTCFIAETERVRRQPTITATNTHDRHSTSSGRRLGRV